MYLLPASLGRAVGMGDGEGVFLVTQQSKLFNDRPGGGAVAVSAPALWLLSTVTFFFFLRYLFLSLITIIVAITLSS